MLNIRGQLQQFQTSRIVEIFVRLKLSYLKRSILFSGIPENKVMACLIPVLRFTLNLICGLTCHWILGEANAGRRLYMGPESGIA